MQTAWRPDVFEHTYYHDTTRRFVAPFLVSPDGDPVTLAERVHISAHYSFEPTPDTDILIVPRTANSLGPDLQNDRFLQWMETTAREAVHAISVCNGAFPLRTKGLLDGRQVTTYPDTQDQLVERFPEITVRGDVRFIQNGPFITSMGETRSYEPALHLIDPLYGTETARNSAGGLVRPWDRDEITSAVVQ